MALLAGGGSAQLRRDTGTAGAVSGQQAFGSALAGANLATALPFYAKFQAGDGQAQLAQTISVTGSLAVTESGADAFNASGTVGSTTAITGSLNAAETGNDSVSASGKVIVRGVLSTSSTGADGFSSAGKVIINGPLAAVESGTDAAAFNGRVIVKGAVTAAESGSDIFSAAGSVQVAGISGQLHATESGGDVFFGTNIILLSARKTPVLQATGRPAMVMNSSRGLRLQRSVRK